MDSVTQRRRRSNWAQAEQAEEVRHSLFLVDGCSGAKMEGANEGRQRG